MKLITAPEDIHKYRVTRSGWDVQPRPTLFLGGSIEQGKAEFWQDAVAESLKDESILLFNPRRQEWDELADEKFIRAQIRWELAALEESDAVLIYLQPGTLSPISMLEFGLYARAPRRKLVVVCPPGFWRRTNIEETAARFGIPLYDTIDEGVKKAAELAKINYIHDNDWAGPLYD